MAEWNEERLQRLAEAIVFHRGELKRTPVQSELSLGYGGNVVPIEVAKRCRARGGCANCVRALNRNTG